MNLRLLILIFGGYTVVSGDFYAAMVDMEDLLTFVKDNNLYTYTLEAFIHHEEYRINKYERMLKRIEDIDIMCENYVTTYAPKSILQPVTAYKLTRNIVAFRNTVDNLLQMERLSIIQPTFSESSFLNVTERLPTLEDLNGTANAITRLQEVYKMPVSDVISGVMYNHSSRPLAPLEVLDIVAYTKNVSLLGRLPNNKTLQWLLELNNMNNLPNDTEIHVQVLIEMAEIYINSKCHCSIEFSEVFEALKIHRRTENFETAENLIKTCKKTFSRNRCVLLKNSKQVHSTVENFYSLCRGESMDVQLQNAPNKSPEKELKCLLEDGRQPLLILNPMKVEILNKENPYIIIIHDAIRANEIDFLKSTAKPFLKRGTVMERDGQVVSDKKISKTTVLKQSITGVSSAPANKFRNRLVAKLGLNNKGFEPLQVANYGLGGIYNIHLDIPFPRVQANHSNAVNMRLVSAIHYLTDVEDGGMTVFPELGIVSPAKKGNALLFFNLFQNGTGNPMTTHASCPVIYGDKWISVQWVTRYHQEFRYPCSTNRWE